uniref:Periplasmic heavy metal sensor n=1 Tax=candidate division WOR-3 bacterium TaxID=2052148 RepID=A0A7C6A950_UNCW3
MRTTITALSLMTILSLGLFGLNKVYSQPVSEPVPCPHHQKMEAKKEIETMQSVHQVRGDEFEISPEQERSMHQLKIKLHKEIAPLRTELEIKEMELEGLWLEDKPDVEKIVKKVQEIHKIRGLIQEKEIRHRFEIYKTLKPEQQKIFRTHRGIGFGLIERCLPPPSKKCMGCDKCETIH